MSIYAIADLHLSGAVDKPMDVFGNHWAEHWDRIKEDWTARVKTSDTVLIPGDISWAMSLEEARLDLDSIGALPGKKVMIKGNHDYWWSSPTKIRSMLPTDFYLIQNDSLSIEGYSFCGTRGWMNPGMKGFGDHDTKIFTRELQRLRLSLERAETGKELIVMLHYPPFDDKGQATEVVEIIKEYKPSHVVYGHLHGDSAKYAFEGQYEGTAYHLVSCDYLNFKLKRII